MFEKNKYYAIKVGNGVKDTVVDTWAECESLVKGYPSVYKSFKSIKEANKYLKNMTQEEVDMQLLWNEIHRENRIRNKIQFELGFKIPDCIINEIINNNQDEIIYKMIENSVKKGKISKKDAKNLSKYISEKK